MTEHRRTLLAVHAHPDDEAFSMGGVLARCAAQGVYTVVVCATRGDVGEIHDPDLDPEEARGRLAAIREDELRRACAILGVNELHFLGYRDSGMIGTDDNTHPLNFHNADLNEATGRVVRIIRQTCPQVVIGYDERGGYGHPDHLAVYRTTLAAFDAAADPLRYSEQHLPIWQALKLYETAFSRSQAISMGEALRAHGLPVPFDRPAFDIDTMTVPDDQITTRVDIREYVQTKRAALEAHRTQLGVDNPMFALPDDIARESWGYESFHRVRSLVPASDHEDDLFAGIP